MKVIKAGTKKKLGHRIDEDTYVECGKSMCLKEHWVMVIPFIVTEDDWEFKAESHEFASHMEADVFMKNTEKIMKRLVDNKDRDEIKFCSCLNSPEWACPVHKGTSKVLSYCNFCQHHRFPRVSPLACGCSCHVYWDKV